MSKVLVKVEVLKKTEILEENRNILHRSDVKYFCFPPKFNFDSKPYMTHQLYGDGSCVPDN